MPPNEPPFTQVRARNNTALVGAQWWQKSLAASATPVARRELIMALGAFGLISGMGVFCAVAAESCDSDSGLASNEEVQMRDSVTVQKDQGWNFGVSTELCTYNGETTEPFDKALLDTLASDLAPKQPSLAPFAIATLLQSASSTAAPTGATTASTKIRDALKPIHTTAMDTRFAQGKAMGSLFEGAMPGKAVIIDLSGPEAVAFAAGISEYLEPVFLLDNWPHPRGVVPAHLTLAAAAYYSPLFKKNVAKRKPGAAAAFVLDRNRLTPYTDDSDRFDNRYMARLPTAESLKALGVKQVLYVLGGEGSLVELDDVNADLAAYAAAGIEVKYVSANDFIQDPKPPAGSTQSHYYGGSSGSHYFFWSHYNWGKPPRPTAGVAPTVSGAYQTPATTARTNPFNPSAGGPKQRPTDFGKTAVIVDKPSGRIVGSTFTRSGSFGRATSSWGGLPT